MENLGLDDALNDGSTESGARKGISRRTIMKGAAWTVPALMVTTAAPAFALSCQQGTYRGIGRGKFLSGGLLNVDLDSAVSVNGRIASTTTMITGTGLVHVAGGDVNGTNGTVTGHTTTAGQTTPNPDWHASPLDVTALGSVTVSATGVSSNLLSMLLGDIAPANAGAANQYAYSISASNASIEKGASGAVTNTGTVNTGVTAGTYPTMAKIDLKAILTSLLGSAAATQLAGVANLQLQVGAVAGRAWIDRTGCPTKLTRDYAIAQLLLLLESGLVSGLVGIIRQATLNISIAGVAGLSVSAGIIASGSNGATPPKPANPPLPIPTGASQPIQANLSTGVVTIDLATLFGGGSTNPFGQGYQPWLNGRTPNTILFVDYALPSTAITTFMSGLITGIEDRMLDAVSLTILGIGGTLRQLLANPLTNATAQLLVNAINALFTTAGPVKTALDAISALLARVFGFLHDILNITLNVQNDPNANTNPATPTPTIDPVTNNSVGHVNPPTRFNQGFPAGRYDVAALGINGLVTGPTTDDVVNLFLARGSAGPDLLLSVP